MDPAHDPIEDREHVGAGRHRVQREPKSLTVVDEHTVGDDDMEVHVQVDQPTKALDRLRRRPLPHGG
ncbi:MAG: hypothetical protein ACREJX_01740, partial [Polyangiaceae bacterium]